MPVCELLCTSSRLRPAHSLRRYPSEARQRLRAPGCAAGVASRGIQFELDFGESGLFENEPTFCVKRQQDELINAHTWARAVGTHRGWSRHCCRSAVAPFGASSWLIRIRAHPRANPGRDGGASVDLCRLADPRLDTLPSWCGAPGATILLGQRVRRLWRTPCTRGCPRAQLRSSL